MINPNQAISLLADPPARTLLEMLMAADASLDEGELAAAAGSGAAASLNTLDRYGIVHRESGRLRLAQDGIEFARGNLGEPSEATWEALARVAERTHAGWPQDPALLLLRCRLLTRRSRVPAALDLVLRCQQARHAVALPQFAAAMRTMAVADPSSAQRALTLLAEEQLRRGEIELAHHSLDQAQEEEEGPESSHGLRVLRAKTYARAARPSFALEELKRAALISDESAPLLLAGLSILRGELRDARRALFAVVPGKQNHEGRRWASLALTYVCEERFEVARSAARRARLAYGVPDIALIDPMLFLIDFLSRLHLDQLDAAGAMLSSDGRRDLWEPGPVGSLLRAALLGRQGDLLGCVAAGTESAECLARRGDRFLLAILQRYLGHAALGLGQLDRSEQLFRSVAGIAQESDMAVLSPLCEFDFALLADARGDLPEARRRSQRALALAPRNPYVRIEAWVLADHAAPCLDGMPGAVSAYGQLRRAERALQNGELDEAYSASCKAADWYRKVGARYDLARALVAQAEALTRLGNFNEARNALASCEHLAKGLGLLPLVVACHLIRASIADRSGDIDEYAQELVAARRRAGTILFATAPDAACARLGIIPSTAGPISSGSRISRLGLARPATWLVTTGELTFLSDKCSSHNADLELNLETSTAHANRRRWDLSSQPLLFRLLEALVAAGSEGMTVESLFEKVWGGEYHQLRHRNTVYGALNRLRSGLDDLLQTRTGLVQEDGRYRLRNITVAIICASNSSSTYQGRLARLAKLDELALPTTAEYAQQFGMSTGHARWELALFKADAQPCSCPGIPNLCVLRRRA